MLILLPVSHLAVFYLRGKNYGSVPFAFAAEINARGWFQIRSISGEDEESEGCQIFGGSSSTQLRLYPATALAMLRLEADIGLVYRVPQGLHQACVFIAENIVSLYRNFDQYRVALRFALFLYQRKCVDRQSESAELGMPAVWLLSRIGSRPRITLFLSCLFVV